MQQSLLEELARRHGIAPGYFGATGDWIATSDTTRQRLLEAMGIKPDDASGADLDIPNDANFAGNPCYLPAWLEEAPAWGISLQLYELRSDRDWGIGDFAALAEFSRVAAAAGADFVGLTPLHALFLADPDRCSPFSPSNRRFLNPLYLAVDRVGGFDPAMVDDALVAELRGAEFVDYRRVAEVKLRALRALWQRWKNDPASDSAFEAFRKRGGEALFRHALFEALSAHMTSDASGSGWTAWPREYHDPEGAAVREFAERHEDEIAFHAWLQWLADCQLGEATAAAREAGMRIGLYVDMAVGETPDGSAVWSDPHMFVTGATIGAPPDYFSAEGQEWGVTALSPLALPHDGYAGFTSLIEAIGHHSGALRIDHVMALRQLFLVPDGCQPGEGAHLRYPMADLLEQLAALSHRNEMIVIGEDLGYVPDGFRDTMQQARILSYRIVYFEKPGNGSFRPAGEYPQLSIACLSTHDLPTLVGWWRGSDIELRRDHGLIDEEAANFQAGARMEERYALVNALGWHERPADWGQALTTADSDIPESLVVAIHGFVADTRSVLAAVRLADLTGEGHPTNLPGTSNAYPNWRRRSTVPLEDLAGRHLFRSIATEMASRRPQR